MIILIGVFYLIINMHYHSSYFKTNNLTKKVSIQIKTEGLIRSENPCQQNKLLKKEKESKKFIKGGSGTYRKRNSETLGGGDRSKRKKDLYFSEYFCHLWGYFCQFQNKTFYLKITVLPPVRSTSTVPPCF